MTEKQEKTYFTQGYGERFRRIRKERGMTMEEFGKLLDVSPPTIAAYENEHRFPRMETVVFIAKKFGYSVDYLLGLSDLPQIKIDILDAERFFLKEQINWKGRPIDPKDLEPFKALLQSLMTAKTYTPPAMEEETEK